MKESISFDRAANIYDATRKLPGDVAGATTQALLTEIRNAGAERVLEVGIGTGRMSRPLMQEGVRMSGVDISSEMMGQLLAQLTPAHTTPDLMLGDATRLPLRDASFRAVMMVHVLHLVASIEQSLVEVRRVLAPGGVFLHQTRRPTEATRAFWNDSHREIDRLLGARGFVRPPRHDELAMREMIRATGATPRIVEVARVTESSTADEEVERIRGRTQSWTWLIPSDLLDAALPDYERWLRKAVPNGWTDDTTLEVEVWRWD
jgi:ubiquinone/menaquinone biosynthesis C-methylase UbiE